MMNIELNPGDSVWFYGPNHKGNYTKGVIDGIYMDSYGSDQYVIRVETHIEPVFYIYDKHAVSDDPNKPIGLWRLTEEQKRWRKELLKEQEALDKKYSGWYAK